MITDILHDSYEMILDIGRRDGELLPSPPRFLSNPLPFTSSNPFPSINPISTIHLSYAFLAFLPLSSLLPSRIIKYSNVCREVKHANNLGRTFSFILIVLRCWWIYYSYRKMVSREWLQELRQYKHQT